jgi:hypothetical protein
VSVWVAARWAGNAGSPPAAEPASRTARSAVRACTLGLACAVDRTNHAFVYHTDGIGSVREVTIGSGAIVATYQTDAFGNPLATGGTFTQPF